MTSARPADHVSTLKFIERLWGLPTLAARNHTFDHSTPTGGDYDTGGAPAPPRDGLDAAQRPVRPVPLRTTDAGSCGGSSGCPLTLLAG